MPSFLQVLLLLFLYFVAEMILGNPDSAAGSNPNTTESKYRAAAKRARLILPWAGVIASLIPGANVLLQIFNALLLVFDVIDVSYLSVDSYNTY